MAREKKRGGVPLRAVVSINPKGEIHGAFESISQAAKLYGSNIQSVWKALNYGTYFRKLRWMYEADYRELWMQGRTHELVYNRKQEFSEKVKEGIGNMTPEQKAEHNRNKSEARKKYLNEHPDAFDRFAHHQKCRAVRCETTGEEFESIKACAEHYGLNLGCFRRALSCRGGRYRGKIYVRL